MTKTVFILKELNEENAKLFNKLSLKIDLIVVYFSVRKIKKQIFKTIHLTPKKKTYTNLSNLEEVVKDTKVVIPHAKLPSKISKVIKKNVVPQNLIIWSSYTNSLLNKNKIKSYLQKSGYFFRAMKSNLIIAQSKISKNDLGSVGVPMAGQKLKVINRSIEDKKSLEKIHKNIKNSKDKQITFGVLDTHASVEDIDTALMGISFYSKEDSKFLISAIEPKEGRVSDKVKVDERILFVKRIPDSYIKQSDFIKTLDFLICPSLSPKWSRVVQLAHIYGVPVIAPKIIPYINMQEKDFKDLILIDISPIHISKAIAEAVELYKKKKTYSKAKEDLITKNHKHTIENEVEEWIETLHSVKNHT